MLTFTPLAIVAAAAILLPSTLATFDASANTNMAVYWGQGPNQEPLEVFCEDDNIDIIPIGFVNVFPDQSGGYPGTNFGNQCGPETYDNLDGSSSLLLSHCPGIGSNITYCQSLGKKILLSLGGAYPTNQHLDSDASAVDFATFLWEAFGPPSSSTTTPRPFGDAVVDGFDFDIESVLVAGENSNDLNRGYGTMVDTLRALYDTDKSKTYYISAAPQCIVPDVHLADAIETSPFDFLFVQFYNTPQCSARAYFDHSYGGTNTNISFGSWVNFVQGHSNNPDTKVYLGLPASTGVVNDAEMYLQPNEASEIIKALQCEYKHEFGGVMIYEATFSQNNQINGHPYADVLKGYLENAGCPVLPPVSSSATVQSTRVSSSTPAVSMTSAVSTTHAPTSTHIASSLAPTLTSLSLLSAVSSGSFIPTSSGGVVVSVTEVSTISRCPPNVPHCPFSSQATPSSAPAVNTLRTSSSSAAAVTTSVPAPVGAGITTASVSLFTQAYGNTNTYPRSGALSTGSPSPIPSVNSTGLPPNSLPSTGLYQTANSTTGFFAPTSIVPPSTPTPILSGTTVAPVPESISSSTYTTVTSCPVTTTKVLNGTTSIIVETSLITSTVTICPRCSEKTKAVSASGISSITLGEFGTTTPAPVPSSLTLPSPSGVATFSPSAAPAGQSSGLLPSLTTYTTTEIVSTLTTTCTEATTFSLSSGGRVYTATANETLTIPECPCTLTYKTTGYSVPTGTGPNASNANGFLVGTSHFGTPGSSGAGEGSSGPEAAKSESSSLAGSGSPLTGSESSGESSNGSSGAGSPSALNGASQSNSNIGSGASSPGVQGAGSQSSSNSENGAASPGAGSPETSNAGSQSKSNAASGASAPNVASAGAPSAGTNTGTTSGSELSSPAPGNKAGAAQQSPPEQSTATGSPSESGASGSVSKAGEQGPASGVNGAHHPVVTLEVIPVPESPSQIAQSGKANENGKQSGKQVGQQSGQQTGQQSGQQVGQQKGQQSGGQQSGQQNGQNGGTQSEKPGSIAPLSGSNSTAAIASLAGTAPAIPSGTAPASQGGGSGGAPNSSPIEFKGAASRVGGSLFCVLAVSAVLLLS